MHMREPLLRWVALGALLWAVLVSFALMILNPSRANATPTTSCAALLKPSVCYQRYLQAIQEAARLKDLHAFLSTERVSLLQKGLAGAEAAGADPVQIEQLTLQTLQREARPPDRIVEHRFDRDAILLVHRVGVTVEVRLVIEDETWRISDERFRATPHF
jgi:hypothetical protein